MRLNFLVSEAVRDRIEALQERSDARNMTEVIRRALALYDEILTVREEGGELIVRIGDVEQKLLVL